MCGDYNVDLLKINSLQFNENYFDSILSAGYIPTITLPTRLSENNTLIDNIFTTNLDNNISACILNIHISDHQPVVLFVNDDKPPTKAKYITVKSTTDGAKERFRTSFHNKHVCSCPRFSANETISVLDLSNRVFCYDRLLLILCVTFRN